MHTTPINPNECFESLLERYGKRTIECKNFKTPNSCEGAKTLNEFLEILKRKEYSDIQSKGDNGEKLQWVHFVQEGGGTLGISLVGFTFVLEYVGIRFLKLAGTSAGAINTLFLAAIGKKYSPKSPELFKIMTDKERFNLESFVDTRSVIMRKIILSLNKGMGLIKNVIFSYLALLISALLVMPFASWIGREGKIMYALFFALFITITGVVVYLIVKLAKYNFGINPGNKFESFLERELERCNIIKQQNLDDIAKGSLVFVNNQANDDNLGSIVYKGTLPNPGEVEYDYAFVTSDFNNQCKIVLPKEAELYFDNPLAENPAKYVRASMAIPLFFEPKILPDKDSQQVKRVISTKCKKEWEKRKGIPQALVEENGLCMDGGSISNFPISLLHNHNVNLPRMPIIGARINDSEPKKKNLTFKMGISDYVGSVINTIRGHEDSSFISSHPFYKKYSIADIKAYETKINWLNFNLNDKQKDDLFMKGVEAAVEFLCQFDWDEYKQNWVQ